jgi:hypothetical protein
METITVEQVKQLLADNHVVAAYPRKKLIVVDGFKRFAASPAAINAVRGKAPPRKKNPAKRSTAHLKQYQFKKGAAPRTGKKRAAKKSACSTPVRTQYVIAAQGTGKKIYFDGGKRFTENAKPHTFSTQGAALKKARSLMARYPTLKRYRVTIESF